ncbi:MAG TPA: glycosyltransferase family 4 protein [Candidatus Obscuribacterales bacterium]
MNRVFRLRICLISREYPPETGWGGIGAYTYQHARALKKLGHDVEVIALTPKDSTCDTQPLVNSSDPLYVPVHRACWGFLLQELATLWISLPYTHFAMKSAMALWRKFLEVHNRLPFDVVEAPEHLAEGLFFTLTGICPLVVRLHTPHSKFVRDRYHNLTPSFDHKLLSMLERLAILEANVLSSPSRDLAQFISEDCGIQPANILHVPNPVDVQKFTPDGETALHSRNGATVLFAGRLEERKGIQYLIDAVPLVLKEYSDVRFIIVGSDTETAAGKTSVLRQLKQKLARDGCAQAVQFVGQIAHEQMPAYYRSADICVVPSLYENAPYTVLEAQSSGKPVVTTSAGGSKEYVIDGETGVVVAARDSEALAGALITLLRDKSARASMGWRARETAVARFSNEVIAEQAIATYQVAIDRHHLYADASLYRLGTEKTLTDFVSLLHSYHKNLCDLIARHSLMFRMKRDVLLLYNRPRLFAAKLALALFLKPASLGGARVVEFFNRLDRQVQAQEEQREQAELQALLRSCRAGLNLPINSAQDVRNDDRANCADVISSR